MSTTDTFTSVIDRPSHSYIPRGQMKHLTREAVLEEMGPSRLSVIALLLILVILIGSVVWANFVPVTTATTVMGSVVPSGAERIVQHFEGGIVQDILVADGDNVTSGQTLIRIDPTQRQAELGQIEAREAALRIREMRLRAQLDGSTPNFSDLEGNYPVLVEEAKVSLMATRERIAGQHLVQESKIAQRRKTVESYRKQAASLRQQLKLVGEAVEMREKLFASGHGSRVNVITAQLELSKVESSLASAIVSAEQAEVGIDEAKNELNEILVTERDTTLEALSSVLSEQAEVQENLARLRDRVNRLDVLAPVNGIVQSLAVNAPGAVVKPAATLLTIIPSDEAMIVEVEIAPKDIGHISIGQRTKVVVNGFDQRRYGAVPGHLMQLSATTILNEAGKPFFKGRIKLEDTAIHTNDGSQLIVPGMTVTADIVTGKQSLLQYLTGPVYNALATSFSER